MVRGLWTTYSRGISQKSGPGNRLEPEGTALLGIQEDVSLCPLSFLHSEGWLLSFLLQTSPLCLSVHLVKYMAAINTSVEDWEDSLAGFGEEVVLIECLPCARCPLGHGDTVESRTDNPAVMDQTFYDMALTICLLLSTYWEPGPNFVPRTQHWAKSTDIIAYGDKWVHLVDSLDCYKNIQRGDLSWFEGLGQNFFNMN